MSKQNTKNSYNNIIFTLVQYLSVLTTNRDKIESVAVEQSTEKNRIRHTIFVAAVTTTTITLKSNSSL